MLGTKLFINLPAMQDFLRASNKSEKTKRLQFAYLCPSFDQNEGRRLIERYPTSLGFLPRRLLPFDIDFFLDFGLLIELVKIIYNDRDWQRYTQHSTNGTGYK